MLAMGEEEEVQKCSNSSSGGGGVCSGRSSKKFKPKKVPQRGLGVAQLEKIRLEEQHRRDNNNNASSFHSPNSLPCLQLSQSPSILLPNISRPMPMPPAPSPLDRGHSHWPRFWNSGEYNLVDGENQRLDRPGIGSHASVLPLPTTALQRSQQYQHHPASSSMVNILSGISPSSVHSFQIEPPSNQNYRGNDYTPLWPDEVKIVGVKRPYPFTPEYPPVPSFNCKFASSSRANEATCCSTVNAELCNPPIRNLDQENGGLGGDFLTLAPPSTSSSSPRIDPRYYHCSRNPFPLNQQASTQRRSEELMKQSGMNGSGQPHIFSFFPAAKVLTNEEESPKRSYKSDSNGVIDLNLKL